MLSYQVTTLETVHIATDICSTDSNSTYTYKKKTLKVTVQVSVTIFSIVLLPRTQTSGLVGHLSLEPDYLRPLLEFSYVLTKKKY